MLPAKNRLNKKKDFNRVFKKGKALKEDFLILKYVKTESKHAKFGFIVSKKVAKKATIRNKVKRILRELIRARIPRAKKGIDAVLIGLPGIEKKEFLEVEKTIEKLFKKANIYEPNR